MIHASGRQYFVNHIATADDAVIGNIGERPDAAEADFVGKTKSEKYSCDTDISMPRSHVIAGHAEFQWLGLFATGAVIMILGAFSALMPRRTPGNPVAEIESALQAGEFVPYYQPIVDIRSGQLRGAEVLVRWRKPDGTLVLSGAFIPLAESSGLIGEMTRDVMRRVCAEAGHAVGCWPALKVSFNFAGQLFSDETIVKYVHKIFSGSPIKLSQGVLEVTERAPIENFTATRQTIAAFQQGYVFAPPLPGKAFLQLVEAIDPLPAAAAPKAEPARATPKAELADAQVSAA